MHHGRTGTMCAVFAHDPKAARIAALSAAFLEAGPEERALLAAEYEALMAGVPIRLSPVSNEGRL